ncbi:MAG: coenzyme F420-0:L-glutamate ligase [Candidatus Dormibacteria bacterium]
MVVEPLFGIPEVQGGDDLAHLVLAAASTSGLSFDDGDVVVVASKVVSKAERAIGQEVPVDDRARDLATVTGFPPTQTALILQQSTRVVRAATGVLLVETGHGYVCANAGIDHSNAGQAESLLLPADPDASAARLRAGIRSGCGATVAVLVSDSFGRPWRLGQVNVALGISGMRATRDYRGQLDPDGRVLEGTELAVADELCAAAELVMNKLDRVPVAVIRGYPFEAGDGSGKDLLRAAGTDLFR